MWPDQVSNPGPLTYESGALPTALRGPANNHRIIPINLLSGALSGLSQPFLGMGPGPLELGKIASFRLKLGKKYNVLCIKFLLSN